MGNFSWIAARDAAEQNRFYSELDRLIIEAPFLVTACVIDRPGYDARYRARYSSRRWHMCKTAFAIVVERACKFADLHGRRLRVFAERADKDSDNKLKGYFKALRAEGSPFAKDTSQPYGPLDAEGFRRLLFSLDFKEKSSPLMQFADLVLYPVCRAAYEPYRPFDVLRENGKLIDSAVPQERLGDLGIKRFCFDWKKQRGRCDPSPLAAALTATSLAKPEPH